MGSVSADCVLNFRVEVRAEKDTKIGSYKRYCKVKYKVNCYGASSVAEQNGSCTKVVSSKSWCIVTTDLELIL